MSVRVVAARKDEIWEPALEELTLLRADPSCVLWVDLGLEGHRENRLLSQTFGVHPLLVEDAFEDAVTPKCEVHEGLLYIVAHGIDPTRNQTQDLATEEVDLFLGERFLVTQRDQPLPSVDATWRRCLTEPGFLLKGPAYVAQSVLEELTDRWRPALNAIEDRLDEVEIAVFGQHGPRLLTELIELQHGIQRLRRVARHQTNVLLRVSAANFERIPDEAAVFFRDVYDTAQQSCDRLDGFRETAASAMDAYLAVQSHRLNEIMRVLTLISTIMLPLTFVVGVYGMNFDHMPELHWAHGYAAVWGLMLVVAISLTALFRWKRWL